MTEAQTKAEVERAQKLLAARGMGDWRTDPETGTKYTEITMVNRGDGECVVLNCSYSVAKRVLEQTDARR
jgi:hypothetical protein